MATWRKNPVNREKQLDSQRNSYRKNKAKYLENSRKYHQDNPERYLFDTARARARRKGIVFSITLQDVKIPSVCPVLGIPLGVRFDGSGKKDGSASIDRIDNAKGYVPGNIAVISHKANQLKSNGTLEDHELLVVWLRQQREKGLC